MCSPMLFLGVLLALSVPCRPQTPVAGNSSSAPNELDLASYERELTRIAEASKNPAQTAEVRRSLPESWKVKDGDHSYSVPTKEIADALRVIEHDPKKGMAAQLQKRLYTMRQEAEQLSKTHSEANAAESESRLKKILGRGEFQDSSGPSAWEVIKARINRWILEQFIRLFRVLHISQKTGNGIAWAVIFLAVVLLFYVLYRWLSKSTKTERFRAQVEVSPSDARHWIQEALAAADRGDFREAVHCAYWAAVAHLEDMRILPCDRARTPRESLRLLDQHPKEQGSLQTITQSFELIWYGYRPISAAEWAGTKEQLEKMGCLQGSTAPTVPS